MCPCEIRLYYPEHGRSAAGHHLSIDMKVANQPFKQSINHSVSQSINQSITQEVLRSLGDSPIAKREYWTGWFGLDWTGWTG